MQHSQIAGTVLVSRRVSGRVLGQTLRHGLIAQAMITSLVFSEQGVCESSIDLVRKPWVKLINLESQGVGQERKGQSICEGQATHESWDATASRLFLTRCIRYTEGWMNKDECNADTISHDRPCRSTTTSLSHLSTS